MWPFARRHSCAIRRCGSPMDGRGVSQYDLQAHCAHLAKEYPFAARREFHGAPGCRRPGVAIRRSVQQKLPRAETGQKGLPEISERPSLSRIEDVGLALGAGWQAPPLHGWPGHRNAAFDGCRPPNASNPVRLLPSSSARSSACGSSSEPMVTQSSLPCRTILRSSTSRLATSLALTSA